MAPMRIPIAELKNKLRFLIRDPLPASMLGHSPTESSFATHLGIARATLRDQMVSETISPKLEMKIFNTLSFDASWPEWRHGTAEDFQARFLERHRITAQPSELGLASLEIYSQQDGPDQYLIGIDIICQPTPVDGVIVSIRRARLEINCEGATRIRLDERAGFPLPMTVEGSEGPDAVKVSVANSTSSRPAWLIESNTPAIGAISLSGEASLIRRAMFVLGDKIEATLSLYVRDLDFPDTNADENFDLEVDNGYSIVAGKPNEKSVAKRTFLRRLVGKRIQTATSGNTAQDGWTTVAKSNVRISEKN